MNYYNVSILGSSQDALTYRCKTPCKEGFIVQVPLKNKIKQAIIIKKVEKPSFECLDIEKITSKYLHRKYQKIAKFISEYYMCSYGEAVSLFVPFENSPLTTHHSPLTIHHSPLTTHHSPLTTHRLSEKQTKAYDFIMNHQASLLFGDTGSGKTEIYMKLFEKAIDEGKACIFLMPEISLTPQMQKRLKEKFGDLVATWHSKISKKAKEKILQDLDEGKVKIVAGARSALFLPMKNIGIIVVDEEHDDSYKSSSRPRYNARDLALYFGKILNTKVALGSATPSLTSYHKQPVFRLKGGYFNDKKKFIYEPNSKDISQNIKNSLFFTLKNDHQAIVFLPTRANFKYLICQECGVTIKCPFCSVGMSVHGFSGRLKCHYCGYSEPIPRECQECKSEALESLRMGTEEAVKELKEEFKDYSIEKFDRDSVTTEKKLKQILKRFNDKQIDILVGTQMLSKGHDYHDINLSVILGIDNILSQADFRSREKALSLLLQIAGRCGRKTEAKVIVQSANSDFFKTYVSDYELFLKDELEYRKELYPPFRKLMRFVVSHSDKLKAKNTLDELQNCLKSCKDIDIIGYGEAPIEKIGGKYRYHLLLRSNSAKALIKSAMQCKKNFCEVDIDPVNFS